MTWSSGSGRYGCIAIVWPGGWIRRLGLDGMSGRCRVLNPATLRNWVEDGERVEGLRVSSVAARLAGPQEVRALKKRIAELERANEILKTSAAFLWWSSTADSSDRGLHRRLSGSVRPRADLCRACRARHHDRTVHVSRPYGGPGLAGGAAGGVSGQRAVTSCGSRIGACTGPANSIMLPVALAWMSAVTTWDG